MGVSTKDHGRLDRVRRLYCDLRINAERLEEVRGSMTRIRSMQYGDRVQHSGGVDYIGDSLAILESIEETIIKQTAKLETEKQAIVSIIRRLKRPEYVDILYFRYVRLMDYESISEKMGYDARYLCKMNRNAVAAFEELEEIPERAAV